MKQGKPLCEVFAAEERAKSYIRSPFEQEIPGVVFPAVEVTANICELRRSRGEEFPDWIWQADWFYQKSVVLELIRRGWQRGFKVL